MCQKTRFRGGTRTSRPVRFCGECSLVKAVWFEHNTAGELPEAFDRTVRSWGTANKATERHLAERRARSARS